MEASSASSARQWNVSLIRTKMCPPRLPAACVQRPALLERLGKRPAQSVTLVTAPAGFGKTTLLAQWSQAIADQDHIVAWLSIDREDDDAQQFGAYLVAALFRASEEIARQAQQILNSDPLTPIRTVISVLLNGIAASDRFVFLVLDDVDRLSAKPVLAIVSLLLRYAPENMHILLGARAEPPLSLNQLKAPDKLTRLGADDLRFSVNEAKAFLERTATLPLDRPHVELLNEATEGWVAGLQLASIALDRVGDAAKVVNNLRGAGYGIDRYLDDTVLSHLPKPILEFLLSTSILERLGPAVCDAITGHDSGGVTLHWLDQHNIFIRPLDEETSWYRYHALLSDALQRRLKRQTPQEVPRLHRRASQWFAEAHLWPEAVRHALAAGDLEQAALWVENCAMEMLERGDPHTLLAWIARLPADAIQGRLRLRLAKAWALVFSLQIVPAAKYVSAVAEDINRMRLDNSVKVDEATLAEVYAVRSLVAGLGDDSESSLELGNLALANTVSGAPWVKRYAQASQFFGLLYHGTFDQIRRAWELADHQTRHVPEPIYSDLIRHAMYGLAALVYGEICEARRTFEGTLARAEDFLGPLSSCAVGVAGCLASIYYESNELPKAHKMIAGRTSIALQSCPVGGLVRYVLSAARLSWRDGERGAALAVLEDGRQIAITRGWLRLRLACDAETVRLLINSGNVVEARRLADGLARRVPALCEGRAGSAVDTWTNYCLLQARVLIAENAAEQATVILSGALDLVTSKGWRSLEAQISVVLSRAFEQYGASKEAIVVLERALRIGEAIRMVNSFVDEGPAIRALLKRFRHTSVRGASAHSAYVDKLLAAFDANDASPARTNKAGAHPVESSEILSARELEVLNHVARGLSNKEIGRTLKLAPETVKWHLKNIFEKLNVNSRIEAVQRVLGLGSKAATLDDGERQGTPGQRIRATGQ
ncbi:LuxR C-terminal-related transcriptional regulator [Paraburkholderia sp. J76]|uniref:LuxR C-terminal-related transcriptional regulator n=1 Tax=Paraburkholderia sp. J76 TaxID=2805439 RepID=UPI002ABD9FC8|nr:LuxR C-terminal-related transcriptional regulator [Paraburkholderia sp. J76]